MLYKPPGAVYIASYKERLDQSDCLFSSEIILKFNRHSSLRYNSAMIGNSIPFIFSFLFWYSQRESPLGKEISTLNTRHFIMTILITPTNLQERSKKVKLKLYQEI